MSTTHPGVHPSRRCDGWKGQIISLPFRFFTYLFHRLVNRDVPRSVAAEETVRVCSVSSDGLGCREGVTMDCSIVLATILGADHRILARLETDREFHVRVVRSQDASGSRWDWLIQPLEQSAIEMSPDGLLRVTPRDMKTERPLLLAKYVKKLAIDKECVNLEVDPTAAVRFHEEDLARRVQALDG